jgi:hypothetical protein
MCVATHAAALVMMAIYLRPGTLIETDAAARATYIASYATIWTIGWSMWMLAAASLVGFYAWWGSRLVVGQTFLSAEQSRTVVIFAVVITAIGMVCDFSGEGSLILLLVDCLTNTTVGFLSTIEFSQARNIERAFTLLSAGAANGLYTIGGILLTVITPDLPKWVRVSMWITWLSGIGMTVAAIANSTPGMALTTAVLFPPFLVWVAWMGARWRRS